MTGVVEAGVVDVTGSTLARMAGLVRLVVVLAGARVPCGCLWCASVISFDWGSAAFNSEHDPACPALRGES